MAVALAMALASASVLLLFVIGVFVFMAYFSRLRYCFGLSCRLPDDLEYGPTTTAKVADDASSARRFHWPEVESLTSNFTSPVIGEGGFSTVYLAHPLPDSAEPAAIKVVCSSERLQRAFRNELDVLLRLRHPNIVRLLGFCDERVEGVLVFEHVSNGTLHERLHGTGDKTRLPSLPWAKRASIAYRMAMAVDYLHEECDPGIVHGDIKSSNVLLDEQLEPKLCDFGTSSVGFSAVVRSRGAQPMLGSPGYVDPHYLRTGIVSRKSDVYSFGVLLLELITGAEAFSMEKEMPLAAIMAPLLDAGKLGEIMDPRLEGEYDAREAAAMVSVARRCVGEQPSLRLAMKEVARSIAEKAPNVLISAVGGKSDGKEDRKL